MDVAGPNGGLHLSKVLQICALQPIVVTFGERHNTFSDMMHPRSEDLFCEHVNLDGLLHHFQQGMDMARNTYCRVCNFGRSYCLLRSPCKRIC